MNLSDGYICFLSILIFRHAKEDRPLYIQGIYCFHIIVRSVGRSFSIRARSFDTIDVDTLRPTGNKRQTDSDV